MTDITEPRLIVEIDDTVVHFFDAPSGDDWPHLALVDVIALIRSPYPESTAHKIENDPEAAAAYVATQNGLVVIIPWAVVAGLTSAAIKGRLIHDSVLGVLMSGAALAVDLQLADDTEEERTAWITRVVERNGGLALPAEEVRQ